MAHAHHEHERHHAEHDRPSRASRHVAPAASGIPNLAGPVTPEVVAALQRAVGNAAVAQAVASRQTTVQRSEVHNALRTSGRPLDEPVREEMEARLDADFSDVRLHTDSTAHAAAESVRATAFTTGSHIVFQRDSYDTSSSAGKRLLAHELGHVIQQREGPVSGTDTGDGTKVSHPDDRFERAAEANAQRAMAKDVSVQRTPDEAAHGHARPKAHAPGDEPPVLQRAIDDTTRSLEALLNQIRADDPAEAERQQQDFLRLSVVLREFDRWMQGMHINYRFGGSLSARMQGAPRRPMDIDVEVSNRDNMNDMLNQMRAAGSGWSGEPLAATDDRVLAITAVHANYPDYHFDVVSETHPDFNTPYEALESMQVDVGAVDSGGLVPRDELILNYLDRIGRKPERAAEKKDEDQVTGLLRTAGVQERSEAERYWTSSLEPKIKSGDERLPALRERFTRIIAANFDVSMTM
ncbi:DUF4157 domain-containing protein [Actinosynnema sp. NPDC023587]|uniref:eCIS core domain-containing protein n=1 Tax=Actinosynnema sp. NPDC023587 TaxID=3154695 RepID=UPI0033CA86DA